MTDFNQATLPSEQREKLIDELADYAQTDLLCYFAQEEALYARQLVAWEPVLQWLEGEWGFTIHRTQGLMPVDQPPELRRHCHKLLSKYDDAGLIAMAQLVTQLGSILLALALLQGGVSLDDAIAVSQLDEEFQQHAWGDDEAIQAKLTEKSDNIRAAHGYLVSLE